MAGEIWKQTTPGLLDGIHTRKTGKKNGADQAMTSPPLEERSIMMSAEIRILLSATFRPKYAGYQGS